MKKLIIIGAGGFGREVFEWASVSADHGCAWTIAGYLDDQDPCRFNGLRAPILGALRDHQPKDDEVFVCGIGRPAQRRLSHELICARGGSFATVIHPTAIIAHGATLAAGVVVCPYVIVSTNTTIGESTAIYYHTSIDHDATVGPWCQISAHCDVTGGAVLGAEVFLGSHAAVLPLVRVGDRAVVGAGAVVTRNISAGLTAVGVPAREIAS
jgi:sugar O-acyltransferase (sialic acid O-acetyltransferase NeuD family)